MGGLGSVQGPEEGRDYIVCCQAYTTAAAAGGIGIGIGIGAIQFHLNDLYWFEGFHTLLGLGWALVCVYTYSGTILILVVGTRLVLPAELLGIGTVLLIVVQCTYYFGFGTEVISRVSIMASE